MRAFAALLSLAGMASGAHASAREASPTRAECAGAYEAAQEQRQVGKLLSARESLQLCANEACPDFVRNDCAEWHDEVQREIPTMVFAARNADHDLSAVRVWAGERLLAGRIDGQAVELDPGSYDLRFEADGMRPLQRSLIVARGERDRLIEVALEPLAKRRTPKPAALRTEPSMVLPGSLLALGAVGVGGFAGLAIKGRALENELANDCSPRCAPGRVDEVRNHYLLGDVSLGVGVTSLIIGTYLLVSRVSTSSRASLEPPSVAVVALPSAAAVTYGGAF